MIISIIFAAFVLVTLDFSAATSLAVVNTIEKLDESDKSIKNLQDVNPLLLNIESLRNSIQSQAIGFGVLNIIALIVSSIAGGFLLLDDYLYRKGKDVIDSVIPQWKFLRHLQYLVPIVIAIFVAISVSFLSRMGFIAQLQNQTITTSLMLILETEQKEILLNLLNFYLINSFGEYFSATSGFWYFVIALLFPGVGYLIFQKNQKLNYWSLVLFTSAIFTVPYWIYQVFRI